MTFSNLAIIWYIGGSADLILMWFEVKEFD